MEGRPCLVCRGFACDWTHKFQRIPIRFKKKMYASAWGLRVPRLPIPCARQDGAETVGGRVRNEEASWQSHHEPPAQPMPLYLYCPTRRAPCAALQGQTRSSPHPSTTSSAAQQHMLHAPVPVLVRASSPCTDTPCYQCWLGDPRWRPSRSRHPRGSLDADTSHRNFFKGKKTDMLSVSLLVSFFSKTRPFRIVE